MRSYHKGSAYVVVIIILVVALVGALGFVFYQNFIEKKPAEQKTADTAKDTPAKTDTTPKADETNYLVIKEWGVKLPAEGVLSDASYHYNTADSMALTTTKLNDLCQKNCSVALINRGKADDDFYKGGSVVGKYKDNATRVGNYYYSFVNGRALQQTKDTSYEGEVSSAYKEAFNKLGVE